MATKWSQRIAEKINQKDQKTCRICSDDSCAYGDKWTRPCKCKGSVEYVHLNCLKEWLTHSNKMSCEICTSPYKVIYSTNNKDSNPFLDYVNPSIAPFLYTVLCLLLIFDVSYRLNGCNNGGIRELYQFARLYTFGLFGVFFLLDFYCCIIDVETQSWSDLLYLDVSYGYVVLFFMLPTYVYEQFRNMMNTGSDGIRNEIQNIVDVEN